jgi:dihydrofolate synthase/folylpolyglutamate synthase
MPPQSVLKHAQAIGADLWLVGRDFSFTGQQGPAGGFSQWSWAGRDKRFNSLAYPSLRGANQLLNASGVLAAFEALRDRLPVAAQAVRSGLATVELPGRFQIVPGQPTLVLDVAHNPHAVAALAQNLDQMGFFPRTHVVFGAMKDKDVPGMLVRMVPLVDNWHFTDLPTPRAMTAQAIAQAQAEVMAGGAKPPGPVTVNLHADPLAALSAALEMATPADRIVVFGSFYTVGGVLKDGVPRLTAKHLA